MALAVGTRISLKSLMKKLVYSLKKHRNRYYTNDEVVMNKTNTENRYVQMLSTGVRLEGILSIPSDPKGLVLFIHGSGSSRQSPRNQYVAQTLQEAGLATLLFDLLTVEEEQVDLRTRHLRFDVNLLARRTVGVIDWLDLEPHARDFKIGLFGSSTGAAAALIAAAELPEKVEA